MRWWQKTSTLEAGSSRAALHILRNAMNQGHNERRFDGSLEFCVLSKQPARGRPFPGLMMA